MNQIELTQLPMTKSLFYVLLFILTVNSVNAQSSDSSFRKSIFHNSKGELPYCFSIGGGLGYGTQGPTAAIITDIDVFHILVGYHFIRHGILLSNDFKTATENSFYMGYQYRTSGFLGSLAAGLGTIKYKCTSGTGGNCYGIDESKHLCIPAKFELDYLISPYVGIGVSANKTFTNSDDQFSVMIHFKYGIFWGEEF